MTEVNNGPDTVDTRTNQRETGEAGEGQVRQKSLIRTYVGTIKYLPD